MHSSARGGLSFLWSSPQFAESDELKRTFWQLRPTKIQSACEHTLSDQSFRRPHEEI